MLCNIIEQLHQNPTKCSEVQTSNGYSKVLKTNTEMESSKEQFKRNHCNVTNCVHNLLSHQHNGAFM